VFVGFGLAFLDGGVCVFSLLFSSLLFPKNLGAIGSYISWALLFYRGDVQIRGGMVGGGGREREKVWMVKFNTYI